MSPEKYHTIDDFRRVAGRRVPGFVFDYLEGGAGKENGLARNISAFDEVLLTQFGLRDVSQRDIGAEVLGKRFDMPIGVAPIGMANLIWPGAEIACAQAAAAGNFPYLLSTAGTTAIETIAPHCPGNFWFQLYGSENTDLTFDLVARAAKAGASVLVVTIDVPLPGYRLRDERNQLKRPLRITPKMVFDMVRRPAWALATAKAGRPTFRNFEKYRSDHSKPLDSFMVRQISARLDVDFLKRIREAWQGPLVVKGVMAAETARAAVDAGADGIIVSNHGGRQLEASPASITVLPAIVEAVGAEVAVMLDSGVRSGLDIVRAYALGARYVFSGRSFAYAYAAAGAAGLAQAVKLLGEQTDRVLGQIGARGLSEVDRRYVHCTGTPAKAT